jgi:uncharacterized protein involved in copper resistance
MKLLSSTILGLALTISPLLAQEPPADKDKPKQQEPKKPEQPPPDDKSKPKQEPTKEQKQQQKDAEKQQQQQEKQAKKQSSQQSTATASNAKRIPPQKYQASFGSNHHFKVHQLVDGRRFQYSGYWFQIVEVWPVGWSYTDDCYIAEDGDDYYLYDVNYPTVRVLVVVVEA